VRGERSEQRFTKEGGSRLDQKKRRQRLGNTRMEEGGEDRKRGQKRNNGEWMTVEKKKNET